MRLPTGVLLLVSVAACSESSTAAPSDAGADVSVPSDPTGGRTASCTGGAGACTTDSQCGGKIPCGCDYGFCLTQSNCRVNSDCAAGQTCSLSLPFFLTRTDAGAYDEVPRSGDEVGGYAGADSFGYFCTTPQDACGPGQNNRGPCVFVAAVGAWGFGTEP